jgi:transcriptional regulator with XRE-family HTH domain
MDTYDIRKRRLRQLIDIKYGGKQINMARETGIKAPQINRWVSDTAKDKRRIEEDSARAIEKMVELPSRWIDMEGADGDESREPDAMELANRLRIAREHAGLSQDELAARIKLTQQGIAAIEKGISLKPRKLAEIARVLGVDPAWIEYGEGKRPPWLSLTNESGQSHMVQERTPSAPADDLFERYKSATQETRAAVDLLLFPEDERNLLIGTPIYSVMTALEGLAMDGLQAIKNGSSAVAASSLVERKVG